MTPLELPHFFVRSRKWIGRFSLSAVFLFGISILCLPLWVGFKGRTLLERCHPEEALESLEFALRYHPWWIQARNDACAAARQAGKHKKAWDHLAKLEEQIGGVPPLGVLHWELIHASMGDLQIVEADLLDLWRRGGPESQEIASALIEGYIRMFRLPDALAISGEWLTRNPESLRALVLRAEAWYRSRSPDNAVEALLEVVTIDPGQTSSRLHLALSLLDKARYDEALKHFDTLATHGPLDGLVESRRARCLHMLGREKQARALLAESMKSLPNDYRLYSTLGQIELLTGHDGEAESAFRKVLEIQESDYLGNFSLSQSLKRQGKGDEAKKFQDRAEQIKSGLERLNEITSTAISQRPLDSELHRELGQIYATLGQEENAKRWRMSADRLNPGPTSR
jgi:tetratricopeptide (TPR) repeat protein